MGYEESSKIRRAALWAAGTLLLLLVVLLSLVWALTFHPRQHQSAPVSCSEQAPMLKPGQRLKVLTWNVQFMAGKNYVFFFDLPDGTGPDERPSRQDITHTLNEVARVIRDENPDLVLLQEVDNGAARTDYEDQLQRLLQLLPSAYPCHTSAFYWKAAYVPHPRIHGVVGLTLATLSKYRISATMRHQLALIPGNFVTQQFNLKRAVLEARLPLEEGSEFVALNTHLDAFAQGSNTMEKQVDEVNSLLRSLTQSGHPWLIGGDFNLLPNTEAYRRLPPRQQYYFNPQTEIAPLFESYQSVPSLAELSGSDYEPWYTHWPNDPAVKGPDRTIDYLFFARIVRLGQHYVRRRDTQRISDHMPVVSQFQLPAKNSEF
jgi:endonuclease/exonuclease/phosphatase family metal-dependent hydrolase